MKATYKTYKRKILKKEKWWMGVALLLLAFYIFHIWLNDNNGVTDSIIKTVFWLLYGAFFSYIQFKFPAAKINFENNKLVKGGGLTIYIPQILSLEEKEKKGIRIHYLFNDMERVTSIPPVNDTDKPRLLADLLQINPSIAINCIP